MLKSVHREVTLEDLANMVAKGFDNVPTKEEVNIQFGIVYARFDSVEKRLSRVEYHVDEVYDILKRFEENDILSLQKRVRILEKAVRSLVVRSAK